jgi:hypothetical protein
MTPPGRNGAREVGLRCEPVGDDDEQELADLESAVLDQLETADDEAPEGTVPLEAARRRRAQQQLARILGPSSVKPPDPTA